VKKTTILKNNKTILYLLFIAFLGLFFYVFLRASILSFTHDESLTFKIIEGDEGLLNTANHHMLNTFLMSLSGSLFGFNDLGFRLPNVLAFVLYLTGVFFIIKKSKTQWNLFLGGVFLLFNPYLLEFFSIARGYGLSISFFLISFYFLIRKLEYSDEENNSFLLDFFYSVVFASLASFSNLSLVNYLITVPILFLIKLVINKKSFIIDLRFIAKSVLLLFLFSFVLYFNLIRLFQLKELGQLYFGGNSLDSMIESLILATFYYIEEKSILVYLIKYLIYASFIIGIIHVFKSKKWTSEFALTSYLIALLIFASFIENILFEALYPSRRTALIMIPLYGIYLLFLFKSLAYSWNNKQFLNYFSFVIVGLMIGNFFLCANFYSVKSWEYDSHIKVIVLEIHNTSVKSNRKATLSNNWLNEPTINYYITTQNLLIDLVNRDGINDSSDYTYVLRNHDNFDAIDFEVVKEFTRNNTVLYKRKN